MQIVGCSVFGHDNGLGTADQTTRYWVDGMMVLKPATVQQEVCRVEDINRPVMPLTTNG